MTHRATIWLFIAFAIGIFGGWWLGSRGGEKVVREEVRYVERESVNITIDLPKPIKIKPISLPLYIYRTDTIREEIIIPADTASIVADYLKKREYDLDFSTDSTGVFKVRAVVYCNRLASASATITPYQREVANTLVKTRKFSPFIGGGIGIGSKWSASIEVGALFQDNHLPRVGYQRVGNGNFITINYGYVF